MIEYNKEIIKDFILEGDPSIKRESIEFTKIYDVGNGVWLEKYIVVDYGVKKEFTYCKNITIIKLKEYEWRLKVETRDQKIKGLGL